MNSHSSDASIFADALNLTISEMAFPDSNELFERRVRMLEKFTRPPLPESLVSKANSAISLTRSAQAYCDAFVSIARKIAEEHGVSDSASLFIVAALTLENDQATAAVDAKTREVMKLARGYFLSAVVKELKNGSGDKTLKEIVDDCVAGTDELMQIALPIQATLLIAKQKQLATVVQTLPDLARLGLIWRGLFYAAVIGKAGGSLEKELARQKVMDIVADASSKVLGVIPVAGEMFDIAKTLMNLYSAMRHKEDHIDELIQQVQSAQEYIDTYHKSLMLWTTFAVEVQNTIIMFRQSMSAAKIHPKD
jgi:hypothetical protein